MRVGGGGEGQGEEGEWGDKLGKLLHVQASTAPGREEGEVRVWEGRGLPPVRPPHIGFSLNHRSILDCMILV